MNTFNTNIPHLRYNPLRGEYILVCANRLQRPWQGGNEKPSEKSAQCYDKDCYMCPGNTRANGKINPQYTDIFVFNNDYPALLSENEENIINEPEWKNAITVKGFCRVLCYTSLHNTTMGEMDINSIKLVIDAWKNQINELHNYSFIKYVQIFENRGGVGNSNPHPHCQVWATDFIPNEIDKETINQKKYYKKNNKCLLCNVVADELKKKERIVYENASWLIYLPFWAVWPFETMILPKKHINTLETLDGETKLQLAEIFKLLITTYDNLFNVIMPLSFGLHYSPKICIEGTYWHMHFHFNPLLLRSSTVRKIMAGFEMFATPQRYITPETAAELLRQTLHKAKSS
jgi:UDPglucose--hexose-1-phosphate uridylyltransferase